MVNSLPERFITDMTGTKDNSARTDLRERKFVFAGNRYFVLEELLARGVDVDVLAVPGSYLERTLQQNGMPFTAIENKAHLISVLGETRFDYFIANGCPYILPISELQDNRKTFVNIHPGPLPDLRGIDPVPGALLLGRDSGAACHLMDDGIDTGPLISRVVIPNTDDLDAGLLYQLSFLAEKEAFNMAFDRGFEPLPSAPSATDGCYYSKKEEDLIIDFADPPAAILRRIRAFSNRSQGARFYRNGTMFRVFDAELVLNPYLVQKRDRYRHGEVVFRYEDCLVMRLGDAFVKLKAIDGNLSSIQPGDLIVEAPAHNSGDQTIEMD